MDINLRLKKSLERREAEAHAVAEEQAQSDAARQLKESEQKAALEEYNAQFDVFELLLRQQLPQKLLPNFGASFEHKKDRNGKRLSMVMSLEPKPSTTEELMAYASRLGGGEPVGSIYIEICTAGEIASPLGNTFKGKLVDNGKIIKEYELNEINPPEPIIKQLFQDFMNRRYPE
ncbi:hypothetical protein [Desulfovibrio sp. QI0442]